MTGISRLWYLVLAIDYMTKHSDQKAWHLSTVSLFYWRSKLRVMVGLHHGWAGHQAARWMHGVVECHKFMVSWQKICIGRLWAINNKAISHWLHPITRLIYGQQLYLSLSSTEYWFFNPKQCWNQWKCNGVHVEVKPSVWEVGRALNLERIIFYKRPVQHELETLRPNNQPFWAA